MSLLTTTLESNDLDSIIDQLILFRANHGKLDVLLDGAQPLVTFTVHVGDTNYDPEKYPNGYLVLGEWA